MNLFHFISIPQGFHILKENPAIIAFLEELSHRGNWFYTLTSVTVMLYIIKIIKATPPILSFSSERGQGCVCVCQRESRALCSSHCIRAWQSHVLIWIRSLRKCWWFTGKSNGAEKGEHVGSFGARLCLSLPHLRDVIHLTLLMSTCN